MARKKRRKTRNRKRLHERRQRAGLACQLSTPSGSAKEEDQSSRRTHSAMIGHTFWAALNTWGTRATTFLVFAVLSRLLSPDSIGMLAFVFVIYSQLALVPSCFAEYLMWRRNATAAEESTLFWFQMLLASFAALGLGFAGYLWGEAWIDHPDAGAILSVFAAQIPFNVAASIPEVLLRRNFAFKLTAMRSLAATGLGGAIGVTLAFKGYGVWSLVWKQLVELAFNIVFLFLAARWRPHLRFNRKFLGPVLHYGSGVAGSWTIKGLTPRIDTLLIGPNLGSNALGYYNIGQKPCGMLWELINGVVMQVAYPHMAALASDRAGLTELHGQLIRTTTLISAPAFAALGALAPQLVPLVFGSQWEQSIVVLQIFCIAGLTSGVTVFSDDLVMASGKVGASLRLNIIYLTVTAALAYVGSQYGVLYVAGGIVLESFLTLPLGLLIAGRVSDFRLKHLPRSIAPGLMTAAVLFAAITLADFLIETESRILRLGVTSSAGVLSLLLAWKIFAPHFLQQIIQNLRTVLARR